MSFPAVDRDQLELFVRLVFSLADPETFVNVRAFTDHEPKTNFAANLWNSTRAGDSAAVVEAAVPLAEACAARPAPGVFCPPVCTFRDAGTGEANVANGLVLTIECDAHPAASLEKLENLIGPASLVVESGGRWTDSETGKTEPKIHAYWVLARPSRTPEEHALLREARDLACRYVGADVSGTPICHPMRWPGSWHRKAEPRLAKIARSSDRRVQLTDVLTLLRDEVPATGSRQQAEDEDGGRCSITDLRGALETIPNDDLEWDDWNKIGMAAFVASSGTDEGREAFDAFSRRSRKYQARTIVERWATWRRSPPNRTGAGKLFKLARRANPSWRRPSAAEPVPGAGRYRTGPNGTILKSHPQNVRTALHRLRVSLSYSAFTGKIHYANGREEGELDDAQLDWLWVKMLETEPYRPAKEFLFTVANVVAREATFHEVRDWLNTLVWDGKARIDHWLIEYAGAEIREEDTDDGPIDVDYVRAVSRLFFLGAVARAFEPGVKFDEMLVLESPRQGTNKSSALAMLAKRNEWFSDSVPIGAGDKEMIEHTRGKWIVEHAELSRLRDREIETLKASMSRTTDRARLAYGRLTVELPRSFLSVGTTNSSEYLRDEQNRRFWPIRIKEFDLDRLYKDVDQLWAEAVHRYRAGESIRLDPALYAQAEYEQQARRSISPWVYTLELALGDMTGRIAAHDVYRLLRLDRNPTQQTWQQNREVSAAMRELGWEKKTACPPGGGQYQRIKAFHKGSALQRRSWLYVHVDPVTNEVSVGPSPMAEDGPLGF